jgi:hypothetical protein
MSAHRQCWLLAAVIVASWLTLIVAVAHATRGGF